MESMTVTVSNKLLGLDARDEMNSIDVSALGAPNCSEMHINHPEYSLICTNPKITSNVESCDPMVHAGTRYSKDPSEVGNGLTTGGGTIVTTGGGTIATSVTSDMDLLSRFKLDDHNFPCKGIHTIIDLMVTERWARMGIGPKNDGTVLQFDRNRNSSNIMEVF